MLACARVGGLVRPVPMPVIEGFTAGIAVVIALQQVPAALGVDGGQHEHVWAAAAAAVAGFVMAPTWPAVALAVGVAALMLLGPRLLPALPFSLVGVALATLVVAVAGLDVALIGALPTELPVPSLAFLDLAAVPSLLPSAVAVAALAGLESLLSATVADGMTVDQRHDPDRELLGHGIANLAAPLFGGVAATGAIFDGPLFFATAHRLLLETSEIADVWVVVLRMSRVSSIDATGAQVLDDAIRRLERRGTLVLLSGLRPGATVRSRRSGWPIACAGRARCSRTASARSSTPGAYLASHAASPAGLTPA